MYCKKICVNNFRNIENEEVSFCEGTNILVGNNAHGKTNLLEAIFYGAVGKSFRATSTTDLISFGKETSLIVLDYCDKTRENNLEIYIYKDKQRKVKKNNLKIDKLSDLVGQFRAVLFCPDHLSMIKEGPAARRNYLDIAISRINPGYMYSLQKYCYFLKQRNALIKNAVKDRKTFDDTVEIYSAQLAEEGAVISKNRCEYLQKADGYVSDCLKEMTEGKEKSKLYYLGSGKIKNNEYSDTKKVRDEYFKLLMTSHNREILAGATLWGVHKDDFEVNIGEVSARTFASQGQQRSLALALKIAEGEITKETYGDYPVFLFDDVLSELDEGRRKYLLEKADKKQVIITTCEMKNMKDIKESKIISVSNGKYKELKR